MFSTTSHVCILSDSRFSPTNAPTFFFFGGLHLPHGTNLSFFLLVINDVTAIKNIISSSYHHHHHHSQTNHRRHPVIEYHTTRSKKVGSSTSLDRIWPSCQLLVDHHHQSCYWPFCGMSYFLDWAVQMLGRPCQWCLPDHNHRGQRRRVDHHPRNTVPLWRKARMIVTATTTTTTTSLTIVNSWNQTEGMSLVRQSRTLWVTDEPCWNLWQLLPRLHFWWVPRFWRR